MENVAKVDAVVKQTTPEQKAKAVEFLRTLDIYKPYINGFISKDRVCFFEQFGGFWVDQEPEVEKKMHEIEEKCGCKVYAIVHAKVGGDDMWSFLVVTSNPAEWDDLLVRDGNSNKFYAFSYTWNKSYDYDSEFGDIGIQSFGGGIRRIW